jgi:membrane-bound lytic murein transglycosylase D
MQFHTVKRGETLATIAKKLRVNRTDLAEANYLRTNSRVAAGTRLIIPRMPSAALLARASSSEPEKATETIAADTLADTTEETKSAVTPARARTYKVRSGDTLSAIARKTGTTITQLKNWNQLRTTNLKIGTQLLIQSPRAASAQE